MLKMFATVKRSSLFLQGIHPVLYGRPLVKVAQHPISVWLQLTLSTITPLHQSPLLFSHSQANLMAP